MIKLGTASGYVLVQLTGVEFKGLAKQSHDSIPDGTNVSLQWVKDAIDIVDGNEQQLASIKRECQQLISAIDGVL
jgi:hypothetical protein